MLNNTSATAAIANATASISNFKSDIFGGLLALSGDVSTTEDTPKFHMNVSLEKVKIEDTFKDMEFIQFIAPIANAFHGLLDTEFRSEERRVGKECRYWWLRCHYKQE